MHAAYRRASAILALLSSAAAAVTPAAPASTSLPPGLDVNDVSILLPLKIEDASRTGGREYSLPFELSIATRGATGEPLVSEQIYADFAKFPRAPRTPVAYSQWLIVALRYDPCALGYEVSCRQELRLVAQPLTRTGSFVDRAIHLVYRIDDGLPKAGDPLIAGLREIQLESRALGSETVGVPLMRHPGLAADAWTDSRSIAKRVREFILMHARSSRLTEIAATHESPWPMFHGLVKDGHWTPAPIFNLGQDKFVFQGPGGVSTPAPGTAAPRLDFLFPFVTETPGPKLASEIVRVMNPRLSHARNLDCMTCHVSQTHASRITSFGDPGIKDTLYVNPTGVTGFSSSSEEGFNRLFGYFNSTPHVSWLVANASAEAADIVNRTQGWDNPSNRDCRAPEIRDCVREQQRVGEIESCLQRCLKREAEPSS